jgi:hypothetical protein
MPSWESGRGMRAFRDATLARVEARIGRKEGKPRHLRTTNRQPSPTGHSTCSRWCPLVRLDLLG